MPEISYLCPLSDIKKGLDRKQLSIRELVSEFIESRVEQGNLYRSWVETLKKLPVFETSGSRALPLEGLVIGIKDNIMTNEFSTKMGSAHWFGASGGFDARIVHNLRSSGAVIGGKTSCSEFAIHEPTSTINPRYPECEPGTSSSGSAAAVAAGEVSLALGTQTAGSIIKPASYCGVIGFKPTFGEIPRTGVLKTTELFDTVGFIGRRVDDISIVFKEVRVKGKNFPLHESGRCASYKKPFSSILVLSGDGVDEPDEDLRTSFKSLCAQIGESMKLEIRPFITPIDFWELRKAFETIYSKDVSYYLQDIKMEEKVSDSLKEMFMYGSSISFSNYRECVGLMQEWRDFMRNLPANPLIISLATSISAPRKGSRDKIDANLLITSAGNPQICLPLLRDRVGKLVGVTFSGARFSDLSLLELAKLLFPSDSFGISSILNG
jgi:Asp-tRNA(Asn)/Glu-tRNA(Gln) amidotransferase A subunit family amidase